MGIQASLAQVFAVCALCAAVEALSGERAEGVRAVCGLSVALAAAITFLIEKPGGRVFDWLRKRRQSK